MTATIGAAFAHEQPALLPLPAHPYPCCTRRPVRANAFGVVTFQTNRYSVPADHVHEALWVHAYVDRLEISNGQRVIAVHARSYGREEERLNPLHYWRLLEERPGAWEQARPMLNWRTTWPAIYDQYLAVLRQQLPGNQAIREFVRILHLHQDDAETAIMVALQEALVRHCYTVAGVKQLLQRTTEPPPSPPITGQTWPALTPVAWPALQRFDVLFDHLGGAA